MTKQEILEYFKDINHAYNESTRLDDLSHMLDELMQSNSDEDCISFPKGTLKKRGKGYVVYNPEWLKENWQTELKVMGIELSVQPKTGHWIDHQEGRWIYAKCSECETVHDTQTNYCPNCGAKMESEDKE